MIIFKPRRQTNHWSMKAHGGFTLVELLVVIALTILLIGLIFAPLIQAFSFTQEAQATAQAQDAARSVTEQLTRELASAAGVRDTTGNYLDLPLVNKAGQVIVAHAYDASIDIIPPRASAGSIVDPTIDKFSPTVGLSTNSTTGVSGLYGSGVSLPLSAGSTVIRYFVGLRYPIDPRFRPTSATVDPDNGAYADSQPYTNRYDGLNIAAGDSPWTSSYTYTNNLNNTYQLYRVNFTPYIITTMGTTTTASVNTELFPVQTVNGVQEPIYDDPDFYRIVNVGDPDTVPGQGDSNIYTSATAEAHNYRVYNWFKLAKQVIATREIDLAGLTRLGNKVVYDGQGNPVDSYESNGTTPIVRTTVNFAPALISNDPMTATNTSNASQAYGATPPTQETSLPYIPTEFAAEYGNWQGTPAVTIAKATSGGTTYLQTTTATSADTSFTLTTPNYSSSQTAVNSGDMLLAELKTDGTLGALVYDITAGAPIQQSGTSIPYDSLILDEDRGVVTFALPALPPPLLGASTLATPPETYWFYKSSTTGAVNLETNIDTSQYNASPLPSSPLIAANTQLVVNSERVVGLDQSPGILTPSAAPTTDLVQYARVNPADVTQLGPNQYTIDYQTGTLQVYDPSQTAVSLQIAYSYQNNVGTGNATDTIRASYYTASMMRLNLGIRVYAPSSSVSQYFSLDSQVGVSNSKAN